MKRSVSLIVVCLLAGLGGFTWYIGSLYKAEADRTACLMHIKNAQTAVRSYHGVFASHLVLGDKYDVGDMQREFYTDPSTKRVSLPVCPAGETYTWSNTLPGIGVPVLRCSLKWSQETEPMNCY